MSLTSKPTNPREAERLLMAIVLEDPPIIRRALAAFDPAWIFDPLFRDLYGLIRQIIRSGDTVDMATIGPRLAEHPRLSAHMADVFELAGMMAPAAALDHYAEEVRRAYIRRTAIGESERLARLAAGSADPDEIREAAIASARAIAGAGESIAESADVGLIAAKVLAASDATIRARVSGATRDIATVTTGWPVLDRALGGGVERGALVTIAGRPSMGKTAILLELARLMATDAAAAIGGGPIEHALFVSLEMSQESLGQRLLARFSEISHQRIRMGDLREADWDVLGEAEAQLQALPIRIAHRQRQTMDQVIAAIYTEASRRPLRVVILDYLQIVRVVSGFERRDLALSDAIADYKAACGEVGAVAVLASQFGRSIDRNNGIPCLSALKETGGIEEHSDIVIGLDRPGVRGQDVAPHFLDLHVLKCRTSGVGVVRGVFRGENMAVDLPESMQAGAAPGAGPPAPREGLPF